MGTNALSSPSRELQRVATLLIVVLFAGCSSPGHPGAGRAASEIEQGVIDQVALILGRDANDIAPTASFDELGIDDLDFVEIVMALEDRFKVSIPDSSLKPLIIAGDAPPFALNGDTTIRDLAAVLPPLLTQQTKASGTADANHEQ
jgi:acyl carrier protein